MIDQPPTNSGRAEMLSRPGKYGRQVNDPRFDEEREREDALRLTELEQLREDGPQEVDAIERFNEGFAEALGTHGVESVAITEQAGVGIDQALVALNEQAAARVEAASLSRDERLAKLIATELQPTHESAVVDDEDATPAEEIDEAWLSAEADEVFEDEAGAKWTSDDEGWKPYEDAE